MVKKNKKMFNSLICWSKESEGAFFMKAFPQVSNSNQFCRKFESRATRQFLYKGSSTFIDVDEDFINDVEDSIMSFKVNCFNGTSISSDQTSVLKEQTML